MFCCPLKGSDLQYLCSPVCSHLTFDSHQYIIRFYSTLVSHHSTVHHSHSTINHSARIDFTIIIVLLLSYTRYFSLRSVAFASADLVVVLCLGIQAIIAPQMSPSINCSIITTRQNWLYIHCRVSNPIHKAFLFALGSFSWCRIWNVTGGIAVSFACRTVVW